MMRKPWQIWLAFLLCLAVVIPAMTWLSFQTIQLDSMREADRMETELARQEAELQERISSALYRMDLKMLPLIAQEASRPHYSYKPFYKVANSTLSDSAEGKDDDSLGSKNQVEFATLPSPLLFNAPEFVLLHFQMGPNDIIFSPQRPVGADNDIARINFGVSQAEVDKNEKRLRLATSTFNFAKILRECPKVQLPQFVAQSKKASSVQQDVYSVPAIDKFQRHNSQKSIEDSRESNQKNSGLINQLVQKGGKAQMQRTRGASRFDSEFTRRADSTKQIAGQQWEINNSYDNRLGNISLNNDASTSSVEVREGVMQPLWFDKNLILARRVDGFNGENTSIVQVCWLDWDAIQSALKAEVADLLPNVSFEPILKDADLKTGTALTTIPVQLVVDRTNLLSTLALDSSLGSAPSGLRLSLWVAWIGLGLASIATAILLYGVLQLSERRATFVSAVTHELRTPLTTFRMYAEMLAEKMVPVGKEQEYANTLRVQADRLTHLVENVLQFARLERGSDKISLESIEVNDLFSRFTSRLKERADEAEMELSFDIPESETNLKIKTQPSTIEQIVFNLVDNACKYAKPSSNNRIDIVCERRLEQLVIRVRDYGPGVAPDQRKRMFKPFCKSDLEAANTAAGVGLGLALCRRMAASLGGKLDHEPNPAPNTGSTFVLQVPV